MAQYITPIVLLEQPDIIIIMAESITTTTNKKGKVLERLSLYSSECRDMLKQALELLPKKGLERVTSLDHGDGSRTVGKSRFDDSSSSDEEDGNQEGREDAASSSTSDSDENEPEQRQQQQQQQQPPNQPSDRQIVASKPGPKPKLDTKQHEVNVRKHVDLLTCYALPVKKPDNAELHLSASLLSKEERLLLVGGGGDDDDDDDNHNNESGASDRCIVQSFLNLSRQLGGDLSSSSSTSSSSSSSAKCLVVLFLRSGRFAGAIFRHGKCIHHRTAQRYTVRKGQGKAQSAQDSQRRPKSIGSQLRRAGEEQLKEDIRITLMNWKYLLSIEQTTLIFISCPKTMKQSLYDCMEPLVLRTDPRIRRVPLDLGRPTYESVVVIHDVLTSATIRYEQSFLSLQQLETKKVDESSLKQTQLLFEGQSGLPIVATAATTATPVVPVVVVEEEEEESVLLPLTALHTAAKNGDLELIRELLKTMNVNTNLDNDDNNNKDDNDENDKKEINFAAGVDFMTPLHYAADSASATATVTTTTSGTNKSTSSNDMGLMVDPSVAAEVVLELLVMGHADPVRVDARNRPPYFLASHEKVRNAFRMARAQLGEDYCDWETAKVGSPLTEKELQLRKDKEVDKKKKKRARQKEKRIKERAQQEEMEIQLKQQQEEEKGKILEAKRIRDGLATGRSNNSSGGGGKNVCDYCQTICKGRQRSQMYKRLEYSYCSPECVQKHKRELMAAAAMARFQQST